jgi:hypothetical protein
MVAATRAARTLIVRAALTHPASVPQATLLNPGRIYFFAIKLA